LAKIAEERANTEAASSSDQPAIALEGPAPPEAEGPEPPPETEGPAPPPQVEGPAPPTEVEQYFTFR